MTFANINSKAENLLSLIKKSPLKNDCVHRHENTDIPISAVIKEKDIKGKISFKITDRLGRELGKVFYFNGVEFKIDGEDYINLLKVIESIFKNNNISKYVSYDFVKEKMFNWLEKRFSNPEYKEDFFEFFFNEIDSVIKDYEVLIPIPFTTTCEPFCIGKINFSNLTERMLNSWFESSLNNENLSEQRESIKALKDKLRKAYQGYLVGCYKGNGEEGRIIELAYEAIEIPLGLLRIVSVANFTPYAINLTQQYGKKCRRKEFFVLNSQKDFSFTEGNMDSSAFLNLDDEHIKIIKFLSKYINPLLTKNSLTEYEGKLFEAIQIYAQNPMKYDISDKLLYVLIALETMLLKNDGESIQQNVGERVAFLVGKTKEERKEIIKIFKEIYNKRSKFVHHGQKLITEISAIENFLDCAWRCVLKLIVNENKFTTKRDLINFLDEIKLS